MTPEQRIEILERTLDECIERYDQVLRFKGPFLCERGGDYDAVDRFRKILRGDALPVVRRRTKEAHH